MANFKFNCRLCGEIFTGHSTSDKDAFTNLIKGMNGRKGESLEIPTMTVFHSCSTDGCVGVADLIGYERDANNSGQPD